MFCDIRQFTDATEALQEEVFVFTNKIAFVVHSLSHSYGGDANKNIGDAFLVSWRIRDDPSVEMDNSYRGLSAAEVIRDAMFSTQEAEKALYAVVKIRLALQNNTYFLEDVGVTAKERLMEKLFPQREGPVVRVSRFLLFVL